MTHSSPPPVRGRLSGSRDDLDGVLRRFFHAEMPNPWPGAPRGTTTPAVPLSRQRFLRPSVRFATAACVALLVVGYLSLQSWFPDPKPVQNGVDHSAPFATTLQRGHAIDRTRSGQPVGVDVIPAPNNPKSFIIRVEELPSSKAK